MSSGWAVFGFLASHHNLLKQKHILDHFSRCTGSRVLGDGVERDLDPDLPAEEGEQHVHAFSI